MLITSHSK